jgi:hypothetical protein
MNSFISNSEAGAANGWAGWIALYLTSLAGATLALYAFVVLLDPFSTGQFTPIDSIDIAFSGRAEANAGRVRDPAFDSAILGNSIATRIQPEQLNGSNNRNFVTLAIPGLGPGDQLALARSFVRGHTDRVRTMVFMLETSWCTTRDTEMYHYPQFPNWLYAGDGIAYLRKIFSVDATQAAFHRAGIRLGLAPDAARRDAYVASPEFPVWRPQRLPVRPDAAPPKPWTFIALDRLQDFRRRIGSDVDLIMYFVPFHVSMLPQPGSDAHSFVDACKTRAQSIAAVGPRTILIDRLQEDEIARDLNNFYDAKHVRDNVVRMMEAEIAAAIRELRSAAD